MSAPNAATAVLLMTAVFAVSPFNAAMGSPGGVSFAVTASVLPPPAVIPVHGTIEAISVLYRAVLLRRQVVRPHVGRFVAGAMARRYIDPRSLIGTHADVMTVRHRLKVLAFMLTGRYRSDRRAPA